MRKTTVLVVISMLCLARPLAAQSPAADSARSVSSAVRWSVMGTLLPAALGTLVALKGAEGMGANEGKVALGIGIGSVGLIFGPGLGHAYAGRSRPMRGAWTRLAGLSVAGLGFLGMGFADSYGNKQSASVFVLMAVGGGLYLYSAIRDIAGVPESVNEYNRLRGLGSVRISPCYLASHDVAGLSITLGL